MYAEALQPFVCGGISACIASTVIHPADLIKTRQQVAQTKQSPVRMVKDIVALNGVRGLYVGLGTALTRQATYGTARIGLHRVLSDKWEKANNGPLPFYKKAMAGMASGALAVCIGCPFDVALVRIQNDGTLPLEQRRAYRNVFHALLRISKEEGVRSLWRGLAPNILRGMAMNVGMMSSYDQAKQLVTKHVTHDPDEKKPSLKTSLLSSAIAGMTAAVGSLPFDLIKSRLMNMKVDPATGKMPYTGVTDCIVKTFTREGPLAFWNGLPAYYVRCAPHAMIILISIEQISKVYRTAFGLDGATKPNDLVTALRFHSSVSFSRHNMINDNDEQDFDDEDYRVPGDDSESGEE